MVDFELDLGREWHGGDDGLGCAGKRDALEGGLGVDIHVARVGRPARVERRAGTARVALVVLASGQASVVGGMREGHEGVVVGEDVCLVDRELKVEDVEELTLDASDITLAEDPCAECPVDVLKGRVVEVLWQKSQDERV